MAWSSISLVLFVQTGEIVCLVCLAAWRSSSLVASLFRTPDRAVKMLEKFLGLLVGSC